MTPETCGTIQKCLSVQGNEPLQVHVLEGENAMCGIVGYIGMQCAEHVLMDKLEKREYRGYDSAGITDRMSNVEECLIVPTVHPWFAPALPATPLQSFAYFTSLVRGLEVDKPRKFAKSVAVT